MHESIFWVLEYYIIIVCLGNVESVTLLKIKSSIGDVLATNLRAFQKHTWFVQEEHINNTVKRQGSIPKIFQKEALCKPGEVIFFPRLIFHINLGCVNSIDLKLMPKIPWHLLDALMTIWWYSYVILAWYDVTSSLQLPKIACFGTIFVQNFFSYLLDRQNKFNMFQKCKNRVKLINCIQIFLTIFVFTSTAVSERFYPRKTAQIFQNNFL